MNFIMCVCVCLSVRTSHHIPTVRVLDALNINMENKARSYESPFLAAVFLMNNYHFIHKTFTRLALFAMNEV